MGNTFTDGSSSSAGYYGTTAGVQDKLDNVLTITASTPVTTTDVAEELTAVSRVVDGRLSPLGYTTPVTGSESLVILGRAVELITAAHVFQRLTLGRKADESAMNAVKTWLAEGNAILEAIYAGTLALVDASLTTSDAVGSLPSVSSSASVLPQDHTTEFVEAYGDAASGE